MKLYWSTRHNFGDSLNPWLWEKLLPGVLDQDSSEVLVGIGTILNHKIPRAGHKHVFGSGYGYGWMPNVHGSDWTIYCVRGPRTAARLNIARNLAITDPALLIRRFVLPSTQRSDQIVFIPHFESLDVGDWEIVCKLADITFVSPCDTIENVIHKIRSAKLVVAEAMHGAIVADALRVPWIPLRPLIRKNEQKWFDWFESLNLVCEPYLLYPSSIHEALLSRYSRLREFVKQEMSRRHFADLFADKTPINEATKSETGTTVNSRRTTGDHLRMFSDAIVPLLDSMIIPPIRGHLNRSLQYRAAEALALVAKKEPYLSSDDVIEELTQRLEEKLGLLLQHVQNRRALTDCLVGD